MAEIGGLGRFARPEQPMSRLGRVPSERSSGQRTRRGAITKTGNGDARARLVEAAWACRLPAREERRAMGKPLPKANAAIARGLAGVVRGIARLAPGATAARRAPHRDTPRPRRRPDELTQTTWPARRGARGVMGGPRRAAGQARSADARPLDEREAHGGSRVVR